MTPNPLQSTGSALNVEGGAIDDRGETGSTDGNTGTGTDAQTNESSFPAGSPRRGATIDSLQTDLGWTHVDVVADEGVDNSGGSDVSTDLEDLVASYGSQTVFELPGGDYYFTGGVSGTSDIAWIGTPGETATVRVDGSNTSDLWSWAGDGGFVLKNITHDMRGEGVGTAMIRASDVAADGGYIKDVDLYGEIDDPPTSCAGLLTSIQAGETLSVHGLRLHDGATRTFGRDSADDTLGIIHVGDSDGELHLGQCKVAGHPNNGVYASGHVKNNADGRNHIRGGVFFNSDRDQIRVGADSEVYYAHCYSDTQKEGFDNLRGIWSRYARGVVVADCLIELSTGDAGAGVYHDATSGQLDVRDTKIVTDSPGLGVRAKQPGSEAPSRTDLLLDGVTITGTGGASRTVLIVSRGGSEFANGCIYQTSAGKDGIVFQNEAGTVTDSNVNVDGDAVINASTSGLTYDETC